MTWNQQNIFLKICDRFPANSDFPEILAQATENSRFAGKRVIYRAKFLRNDHSTAKITCIGQSRRKGLAGYVTLFSGGPEAFATDAARRFPVPRPHARRTGRLQKDASIREPECVLAGRSSEGAHRARLGCGSTSSGGANDLHCALLGEQLRAFRLMIKKGKQIPLMRVG